MKCRAACELFMAKDRYTGTCDVNDELMKPGIDQCKGVENCIIEVGRLEECRSYIEGFVSDMEGDSNEKTTDLEGQE